MRIPGIPEEVELVTSFSELRAGMIVWTNPCRWCGKKHRQMLTSMGVAIGHEPDGSVTPEAPRWNYLPQPPCRGELLRSITANSIRHRNHYRVVDRALDAQTTQRKREMVRP